MGLWKADRPQPMIAAAGPVARAHLNAASNRIGQAVAWQREVDTYDEWGPGFVGSYLDLLADKVTACDALLWKGDQPSTDERAQNIWSGVWRTWRGRYQETSGLLYQQTRLRLKHGECYVLTLSDGKIAIAHRDELTWFQTHVDYIDPVTERKEEVPIDGGRVWRSWSPLDRDPRKATCDLQRALPHIREYINVKLRQDSDTTSPLVRNKILHFTDAEIYKTDDDNDPYNGMPDAYVDYLKLARKHDAGSYHDKRRGVDTVPFPMIGGTIETIDLGRNSDPQSKELEDAAIYAFARSVRTPIQYIHSGPGVAKFENEAYVLESLIADAVQPTSMNVLADIWRIVMRERFEKAYAAIVGEPPGQFRIGPDLDRIRSKIDNSKSLMDGYKLGAVARSAVADALDAEAFDLPEDVSEFDLWKMVAGVPEPAAPAAPAGAAGGSVPAGESSVPSKPAASVAPAVTAAPDIRAVNALLAEAGRVDHTLTVALGAATAVAYAATIDNAARRLSRLAPSGSDLKKRIQGVQSSAEKLAVVTEDDIAQYGITPEALVTDDDYLSLAEQTAQDMRRALEAFAIALIAGLGLEGDQRPSFRWDKAGKSLADGVRAYTRYRVGAGGHNVDPLADVPTGIVRRALSVAGGQDIEAAIQAGAASGPLTREAIENADNGAPLTYTWRHAFYRTPKEPDPIHLSFNGYTASSFDEFGVRYPGDHYNCTCAITLGLA